MFDLWHTELNTTKNYILLHDFRREVLQRTAIKFHLLRDTLDCSKKWPPLAEDIKDKDTIIEYHRWVWASYQKVKNLNQVDV